MNWMPCLVGFGGSEAPGVRLGHPLVDRYLEFVAARARPNTVLAAGYDLKVFFEAVGKDPVEVTIADVLDFITGYPLSPRNQTYNELAGFKEGTATTPHSDTPLFHTPW